MTEPRHFLSLLDVTPTELKHLLRRASELKAMRRRGKATRRLPTRCWEWYLKRHRPEPASRSKRA